MGVMDEVCITFSESDIVIFPLELLCRSFIHVVDIGELPIIRLPKIMVLRPTSLPGEVRTTKDRPDLAWRFFFTSVILWPRPPVVDVVLEVPATNELFNLVFEGETLFSGVTNIFMEPAILVLVPLGAVST